MATRKRQNQIFYQINRQDQKVFPVLTALYPSMRTNLKREISDYYIRYEREGSLNNETARKRRNFAVLSAVILAIFRHKAEMEKDVILAYLKFLSQGKVVYDGVWTGNRTVKQRIIHNNKKQAQIIIRKVRKATRKKIDIDSLLDDVDQSFEENTEKSNKALIVTEGTMILNTLIYEQLLEEGQTHYRYNAVLDDRTTPTCQEMDGKIFPLSEFESGVTAPPMHVMCRSWISEI